MFGFGKKAGPTIGLDINGQTISFLQLEKTKTDLKVVRFASTMTPPDLVREGLLSDPEQAGQVVKELLSSAGVPLKPQPLLNVSIPGQAVVIRLMPVPKGMPTEELNEVVRQEAINNLPFPIDEANLDWKRVPGTSRTDPDGVDREDVLLGAIQRVIAEGYQRMAAGAGLTLGRLEISSLAAVRSLAHAGMLGRDNTLSLLVNIRHDATDITLINKGVPLFSRSVLLGVETILEAISRSINVTPDEALGLMPKIQLLGVPTVDPRLGQAAQVTRSVCSDLTAEVGRSLEFYMSQVGMVRVDQVIVSGSGVTVPEIDQFIANRLNLKTVTANPFTGIVYDRGQILDDRRAYYTVLVGLLADPEGTATKTVAIDLNQEPGEGAVDFGGGDDEDEGGVEEEVDTPWFIPALAFGCVVAVIALAGWLTVSMYLVPQKVTDITTLDEEITQAKAKLDNMNKATEEIKTLEQRKSALEAIVKHGMPLSVVLECVKNNTPKGIQVTSAKIDGSSCQVLGTTADFTKVSHFAINLQGSGMFSTADIGYIKRTKEHPNRISFQINTSISPDVQTQVSEQPPEDEVSLPETESGGPSAVSLPGTKGKAKVLNFFASWLPQCQKLKPFLAEAKSRYGTVEIIDVDMDDPKNEGLKKHFQVETAPNLFFIDSNGATSDNIRGFSGEPEPIFKACEKISKKK